MKLSAFEVNEFRSVWNSNLCETEDITCLVGKNEAGKTTLLKALYNLSPILTNNGSFDPVNDYPRREASEYQDAVEQGSRRPAEVVKGYYKLEDDDIAVVARVFGNVALTSDVLTLTKYYDNSMTYTLSFDEGAARKYVIESCNLTDTVKADLTEAASWDDLNKKLAGLEQTDEVAGLQELVESIIPQTAGYYAFNSLLDSRVPKFLYFDEYYQMRGHENIQALIKRRDSGDLLPFDHPLLGLINLARLNLDDLLNAQRTIELVNRLEGASNILTRQILKYWSQNKHLQMKFDIRDARPEDPEGMQSGHNIWGRVYDQVHWATTELGSRSKGFVWFFSFWHGMKTSSVTTQM
ncbi:AAA family ATPase [Sphingopyxis sp. BSNA05]|uniref:AAA family ATPase n=1 Tax=Sphingopyxis sp. BSNA05 TaxID=1236614 RepID=UPI001C27314B|nr:AAA family ATPase [Sphingopyxis sp. BSNA05]